ncbi:MULTISPECIES: dihydroorotase [Streptomyces]|uniref:dihydroorotase n=1 Tax=Streptomyces TaxID=1883 RepID=UPI0004AAFBAD|nr:MULTISPECIES: dihydroorotase family protein [Streptomyces]
MTEHEVPYDLVIRGGRLVTPEGVRPGTVAVRGGRISALLPQDARVTATETIDAAGRHVLPGVIDSHVHFRTPGLTHKEDWAHGSRAAAAGGVTTVIDMPNTQPPTHDAKDAWAKAALIEGQSLVDYRFHLGVGTDTVDALADLDPRVATSVKVFMAGHHTAPHVIHDPAVLARIFSIAADRGLRVVLHAEDGGLFDLLDGYLPSPTSYRAYEPARPRTGGIVAVARVIELVREYGTAAHILHTSSAEECDLLMAAREAGLPVTFEATPHHLSFTRNDITRLGARIRLSPAIREERDRERLWEALIQDGLATLGSDHAPHTVEEKTRPPADAPPGLPGVQELLPAVFTGMRQRWPDRPVDELLSQLTRLAAGRPAELFGLGRSKGRIEVGYDADLVVFDADATWFMTADDVQSKCGWSAYEGATLVGRPETTVRRGEVIWDRRTGEFGSPDGRWLTGDGQ